MIMVLSLIFVCFVITLATWESMHDVGEAVFAASLSALISASICLIMLIGSYMSYLDIRAQYDATINQYRGAITMYVDYADLDVEKAALTDFKYSGYQENVAHAVVSLRRQVVYYNEILIKKRVLNKNIVFNWLIIGPDPDMKIINIVE